MVQHRFTGNPYRENIYEYPFEAIREAVINSVMHKDYFEHGHNNILKFFPDHIQIENIWMKPKRFILGKTVYRRNKIIADLFSKIHFGEKIGSGMQRMKENCDKEHSPYPTFEFTDTYFYITFKQSHEYLKMAEKQGKEPPISEIYNARQLKGTEFIKEHGRITNKIYVELNATSRETAKRDLTDLVEKKKIIPVGKGRGLYYIIGS